MVAQAVWEQAEENRKTIDYASIKAEAEELVSEDSYQDYEKTNLKPLKAVRFSDIEA